MADTKKTLLVVGASALAAAGCGSKSSSLDDTGTPLALTEARFLSTTQVQLTFSRNLAPVDTVTPSNFALSQGSSFDFYTLDGGGYLNGYLEGTFYDNLGSASAFMWDYADFSNYYGGSPSIAVVDALFAVYQAEDAAGFPSIDVINLALVEGQPHRMILTLSRALSPTVLDTGCGDGFRLLACEDYFSALESYYAGYGFDFYGLSCDGGFMVHFGAAGGDSVETLAGDQTLATMGGAYWDLPSSDVPTVLDPTRKIACPTP